MSVATEDYISHCWCYRPDFTNTDPATRIGPFPQWGNRHKIVAMDPWGHLTPWTFKDIMEQEHGTFLTAFQ